MSQGSFVMGRTIGFRAFVLSALVGLAACASNSDIGPYADGDPRSARALLEQVSRTGAMPVVVQGPIPGGLSAAAVATALGSDIIGVSVDFVVRPDAPADGPRVLVVFGPPDQMSPWRACDPASTTGSGFGDGRRIAALVCDGPSTVAHLRAAATSATAEDVTDLLRQAGQNLFPDPRAERYGYDRYGGYGGYGGYGSIGSYGSNVGVGFGFGF